MSNNHQILFLSHGAGPLPLLGDESHKEMVQCLSNIAKQIRKPSAILVVSAHWEESVATITSGVKPPLIYDYYGFPEKSYRIIYPCSGAPQLAGQIHGLLNSCAVASQLDEQRGFDHGLFVPLKIMFPDADIPVVQLSLLNHLNASHHLQLGAALRKIAYNNLLVIGSGFSFHNMKQFSLPETDEAKQNNEAFEAWLLETCSSVNMSEEKRHLRLAQWDKAPAARFCHPREEHLLPLHVCYGFAQTACTQFYEVRILNKKSSMYLWSDDC